MTNNIISLFSIPVYKKNLGNLDLSNLRNKIVKVLQLEDFGNHVSVIGMKDGNTINTYGIERHMHKWEEAREIVNLVNTSILEYWTALNYHPNLTPYIQEMWATASTKGGYVPSHFHGPTPITAVFYLDKAEGTGNLILQHPLEALLGSQPINFPFDEFAQVIDIQQNDLFMFPGYVRHHTERNTSDRLRISIGMNIASKGNYVTAQWNQI
jgi:uncharacterized protein (TIGR02466 family)